MVERGGAGSNHGCELGTTGGERMCARRAGVGVRVAAVNRFGLAIGWSDLGWYGWLGVRTLGANRTARSAQ